MRSNLLAAGFAAIAASVLASEPCAQIAAALEDNPVTDVNGNFIVDIDTAYVSRCMFIFTNITDND